MGMELDITHVLNEETWGYTGSIVTHGELGVRQTFDNARGDADALFPDVEREDLVDHFKGYGAWSEEELEAMPLTDLRAMLLQDVVLHLREMGLEDECPDEYDWEAYEEGCSQGTYAGNIFRGGAGRIYFYMGE